MSRSPTESSTASLRGDNQFMVNQHRLYEMIHQGKSFSGHERNCCFINLGGGRFGNASALSGFDFDDDGRAVGLVDWDRDGDMDCIVTNRTGPRLRMIMNEGGAGLGSEKGSFVEFRLEGVGCNRDAIGARVRVFREGDSVPLLRSVYAGQGYLAQSSRWLHFGLGERTSLSQVEINWPNGEKQNVTDIYAGHRYVIRQGEKAREFSLDPATINPLAQNPTPAIAAKGENLRVTMVVPLPLPELKWTAPDGSLRSSFDSAARGPILLNLWSAQCRPCLEELQAWGEIARQGQTGTLRIVPINVDAATPGKETTAHEEAAAAMKRLEAPGELGFANPELLDQMQLICDVLLARQRSLPVPTSFLVSRHGDLLAIYQGKISDSTLIEDLKLEGQPDEVNPAAQWFPGRWLLEPKLDAVLLASKFIEHDYLAAAEEFFKRYDARLVKSDRYAITKAQLGTKFVQAKRFPEADACFRESLAIKPDNAIALNDLGGVLKSKGDLAGAETLFREAVRFDSNNPIIRMNLGATLFTRGDLEGGLAQLEEALKQDPDALPAHQLLADTYRRIHRLPEAVGHFEAIARLQPTSADAWMNLGAILLSLQKVDRGIEVLEKGVALAPEHPGIQKNLGMAYLLAKDYTQARSHLERSSKLAPNDPTVHFNLGVLLVQLKDVGQAVGHLREAVKLRPDERKYAEALQAAEALLVKTVPNSETKTP